MIPHPILFLLLCLNNLISSAEVNSSTLSHDSIHASSLSEPQTPFNIIPLNDKTKTIEGNINRGEVNIYYKNLTISDVLDIYRISCNIRRIRGNKTRDSRFLNVVATNGRDTISFGLPDRTNDGILINQIGRLLNPLTKEDLQLNETLQLMISITSIHRGHVSYELGVRRFDRAQYNVKLSSKKKAVTVNATVSFMIPIAFLLTTDQPTKLKITASATDNLCSLFVISDSEVNVYETFSELSNRNRMVRIYPFLKSLNVLLPAEEASKPLYVYILQKPDDLLCLGRNSERNINHSKRVQLTFSFDEQPNIIKPLSFLVSFYVFVPVISIVIVLYSLKNIRSNMMTDERINDSPWNTLSPPPGLSAEHSVTDEVSHDNGQLIETNGSDISTYLHKGQSPRILVNNEEEELLMDKSHVYFMYYIVPALFQGSLQMNSIITKFTSGEQCFFNYACIVSIGPFFSFNHLITNIGYVICAFKYLFLIRIRRKRNMVGFGAFNNYGLELALAASLACQGVASAIYHYCPNQNSYHFDTPFMQVISILTMLKLYGNRHEIVSSSLTHKSISFVLAADVVISKFDQSIYLRVFIAIFHMTSVLIIIYFAVAHVSTEEMMNQPVRTVRRSYLTAKRSVWGIVIVTINIGICLLYILQFGLHTNQVVTFTCIINSIFYFVYYIVCKMVQGEEISLLSKGTATLALLFWMVAIKLFYTEETDWALTTAQSRDLNRECALLSFFDSHDLWHIVSSLSLFFSLLSLSTIDDPQGRFPRHMLAVF